MSEREKLADLLEDTMKETTELDKKNRDRLNDALIDVLVDEGYLSFDDEDEDEDDEPEE